MEHPPYHQLLRLFLDFGEMMLTSGAEIGRVEDSLSRLCRSFGAKSSDVFAITSSIVLTVDFGEEAELTGTRRIDRPAGFNFMKIDALNALCRKCTETEGMTAETLSVELERIRRQKPNPLKLYCGSALAAGFFTLFFGGSPLDGIVAALFGLLICFLQSRLCEYCPNQFFFLFLTCFVSGSGIFLLERFLPFLQEDMIAIGDIMLVVPGIAITMAARDMIIGDTISGLTRLLESLLWAGAVATGFMLALFLFGR